MTAGGAASSAGLGSKGTAAVLQLTLLQLGEEGVRPPRARRPSAPAGPQGRRSVLQIPVIKLRWSGQCAIGGFCACTGPQAYREDIQGGVMARAPTAPWHINLGANDQNSLT